MNRPLSLIGPVTRTAAGTVLGLALAWRLIAGLAYGGLEPSPRADLVVQLSPTITIQLATAF